MMRGVKPLFLLLVVVGLLFGCEKPKPEIVSRPGLADVQMASVDDSEMNKAIEKARETLPQFEARLKKAKPEEFFSIKAALDTSDGSKEHIWVADLAVKDGKWSGTLGNEPLDIPGKKMGSPVTFTADQVSDWMIETNGKFEGGFTADVLAKEAGEPLLPR